jgi:hypothetical protein
VLFAQLRPSNIDASEGSVPVLERIVDYLRRVWPEVKIIVRGDSGFAREELMSWCESHQVEYVLGLARNSRLEEALRGNWSKPVLPPSIVGRTAIRISAAIRYRRIRHYQFQFGSKLGEMLFAEAVEKHSPTVDCGSTAGSSIQQWQ